MLRSARARILLPNQRIQYRPHVVLEREGHQARVRVIAHAHDHQPLARHDVDHLTVFAHGGKHIVRGIRRDVRRQGAAGAGWDERALAIELPEIAVRRVQPLRGVHHVFKIGGIIQYDLIAPHALG